LGNWGLTFLANICFFERHLVLTNDLELNRFCDIHAVMTLAYILIVNVVAICGAVQLLGQIWNQKPILSGHSVPHGNRISGTFFVVIPCKRHALAN